MYQQKYLILPITINFYLLYVCVKFYQAKITETTIHMMAMFETPALPELQIVGW